MKELLINNNKRGVGPTAATPATKDLADITNIEVSLGKQSNKKRQKSNKKSQRKSSIEKQAIVVVPGVVVPGK